MRTQKKDLEYKPHSAGGYTSQPGLGRAEPAQPRKEMVQHYLLEQIKQGWPYDEKFYRPESKPSLANTTSRHRRAAARRRADGVCAL